MKIPKDLVTGIIFSQFDEKIGPIAIAWIPPDLSKETTNLISLKSINIMSDDRGLAPKSLAVIPFPSQKLKGFIKAIVTRDRSRRGGIVDSSITVLFNEANTLVFYQYIDMLESLFNKSATKINDLIESKAEQQKITDELEKLQQDIVEIFVNAISKKPEEEPKRSLLLLFNLIQKNLEKAVNALLLGDQVIVTGDQTLVKLIIDTLTIFSVEKAPKIVYWTKEYALGDIIGGPSELVDAFKTGVLLDLKNGKVMGGTSNKFLKKIIKKAKQLDSERAEKNLTEKIREFNSASNEIFEMVKKNKINDSKIDKLISKLDLDELELMASYLTAKHPKLSDEILAVISTCRKKMDKVLSGFEKETW